MQVKVTELSQGKGAPVHAFKKKANSQCLTPVDLWSALHFTCKMSANLLKTLSLILAAASVVITSFTLYPLPHWRLFCTRAQATVVLLRSILTTHNPSPWVPSPFGSESSAQQRVRSGERGAGKGSSFRVQGSLASSLSSLSWQFPPSTWPVSTLNPSHSMWIFGWSHTCRVSAVFF